MTGVQVGDGFIDGVGTSVSSAVGIGTVVLVGRIVAVSVGVGTIVAVSVGVGTGVLRMITGKYICMVAA